MENKLIYMPTFRSRQQENIVLESFNFGNNMYPLVEIIKEFDRKRPVEKQSSFKEIYVSFLKNIEAKKIFVDIPVYLIERASMKAEVLSFSRSVASDMFVRTDHMLQLDSLNDVIIPVISSYLQKTGEDNSISTQVKLLRPKFSSLCFRILFNQFSDCWDEIISETTPNDFIILDLDTQPPYPSPTIKHILNKWNTYNICPKIVLRSAINDVQNVLLKHKEIVFDADNGLLEQYKLSLKADAFGDYVGIKKDEMTSGGAISPGFLFYDAINNQFYGYKGIGGPKEDKYLVDFENVIVPDVISSEPAKLMLASGLPYLSDENKGWKTLNNIAQQLESGKSQAKFKKIAMEHYLHCIKVKIDSGELN